MINNVTLVGRITKDPELRKTTNDKSTVSFTLACNRKFTQQDNAQQADFINCVAWRQGAEFMANYVKQGDMLGVEGRIQTRSYKDQNDKTVYVTEVVCDSVQILAKKQNTQEANVQTQTNTFANNLQATQNIYGSLEDVTIDVTSEDLPF